MRDLIAHENVRSDVFRPLSTPTERFYDLLTFDARTGVSTQRAQYELMTGLHRRDPYQDIELAAFVARLPPQLLFDGNRARGLFRKTIAGLVPRAIAERKTKARFEPLIDAIFEGAGGFPAFDDLATVERASAIGLVGAEAFQEAWRLAKRGAPWYALWPALCIEKFLRDLNL